MEFDQNLYRDQVSFADLGANGTTGRAGANKPITGIDLHLSRVFIRSHRGLTPANVYLINFVTSDISEGELEIKMNGFERVQDNQTLGISRALFLWDQHKSDVPPTQIHIMSTIIKSRSGLRKTGEVLKEVAKNTEIRNTADTLKTLIKAPGAVGQIADAVFNIAQVLGQFLGKVDDKPLLTRYQSFTSIAGHLSFSGQVEYPFSNRFASLDYTMFITSGPQHNDKEKSRIPLVEELTL